MRNQVENQHILLKTLIIDVFQEFYYRYKKHGIYAFIIEMDETFALQSFLVSTEASIFSDVENKHQYLVEQDKWNLGKWKYRSKISEENKQILNKDRNFSEQDSVISLIFQDIYPQQDHQEKLNTYLEAFNQAILYLTKIYNLDRSHILFLINAKNQSSTVLETAQEINPPSSLLFEFIADFQIQSNAANKLPIKLNQADKDILIDLAQIVEMVEPFDSLFVAHQAYLLTFEPEFNEANLHIQNLIRHISTIDNHDFALSKADIIERIHYFYKI
ncbi:MAG: hypothetical protein RR575_02370 [Acinetobacter sp.]